MLNNPKILILDEPTSGLNPNERIRFRNLLSELSEERLVLLSTHIVSDIEYVANEIILMKDGSIQSSGTPEEIILAMPEQVWSVVIPKTEVASYMHKYKVANIKTDDTEYNIAYSQKQGISDIRDLLNVSFSNGFQEYDYYRADALDESDADQFYSNRTKLLKEWLNGDAKDQYIDFIKKEIEAKIEE